MFKESGLDTNRSPVALFVYEILPSGFFVTPTEEEEELHILVVGYCEGGLGCERQRLRWKSTRCTD